MSELQERLEHLVNYSSQLIFVSGDSIAQQQRALEDFLSVQKENTEISYFTSELTMESPDFRRTICRQLLGQKVGSFVRPLKELLKDLHEQEGPFLLCIKQAQTIPNAFLQELWDWVTESKKQSPDHHVNVILFGETAWAEKAKKWLPKRNSSRPVLLSTQSVDSARFDVNALESLMAEERPTFSLGLFHRNEFSPPIVTQKWFIATILFLLLAVFVGLMSWQYPIHVKSLLQTGQFPSHSELNPDQLAAINEQLDLQNAVENDGGLDAPTLTNEQAAVPSAQQENMSSNESTTQLVVTWNEAKQTSSEKITSMTQSIEGQKQKAPELEELRMEIVTPDVELTDLEGDFAVPDIISVEQLDATLGNDLLPGDSARDSTSIPKSASKESQITIEPIIEVQETGPVDANNQAPANSQQDATDTLYEFNEPTLLALPEPSVLLQISGIQNRGVLSEYIKENGLTELVWVYQTTRYGGPWHVVLLNQRFDSVSAARQATLLLPQSVQATSPFAKELTQIKLEIRNR